MWVDMLFTYKTEVFLKPLCILKNLSIRIGFLTDNASKAGSKRPIILIQLPVQTNPVRAIYQVSANIIPGNQNPSSINPLPLVIIFKKSIPIKRIRSFSVDRPTH